ncbi:hypothetical protein PROCOU_07888 [Listeria rocourtiae FSL F6-920]|nr:hypothetical protein PROCOU_07888 [Listeria rocourtiae FSL F6-920]
MDNKVKRSSEAENILAQINSQTKLGDLRKIAKDTKKKSRPGYGTLVKRSLFAETTSHLNYGQKNCSRKLL